VINNKEKGPVQNISGNGQTPKSIPQGVPQDSKLGAMLTQAVNSFDAKTKAQMVKNGNINLVLNSGGERSYYQQSILHPKSGASAIVLKGF
jgi:hypothetical protein